MMSRCDVLDGETMCRSQGLTRSADSKPQPSTAHWRRRRRRTGRRLSGVGQAVAPDFRPCGLLVQLALALRCDCVKNPWRVRRAIKGPNCRTDRLRRRHRPKGRGLRPHLTLEPLAIIMRQCSRPAWAEERRLVCSLISPAPSRCAVEKTTARPRQTMSVFTTEAGMVDSQSA